MNREDLNWLLQTINDVETAMRFVIAQYERGRISLEEMVGVARERGWINRARSRIFTTAVGDSTQYAASELPIHIAC